MSYLLNSIKGRGSPSGKTRFIVTILLILTFVTLTLHAGVKEKGQGGRNDIFDDSLYSKLQIFSKIIYYVMEFYVEKVEVSKLLRGAINGMLRTLDPYSAYLSKEIYSGMKEETSGKYYGVGVEIEMVGDVVRILTPLPDSPAEKAGILPGDIIVKVDGKDIKGLPFEQVILMIKGPRGTKVTLSIMREGFKKPEDFVLVRDQIRVRSIRSSFMTPYGVGYIKVSQFQQFTAKEIKNAIKELIDESKEPIKGLIIDLRDNPGGLLDEAVKSANLFLKSGLIVSVIGRGNEKKEEEFARAPGTFDDFPIVILLNRNSASAAEIFAGALQDHKRGKVVGEKSFGKGSVQTIYEFEDGSALKLTIALYKTPSGKIIDRKGIIPDVEVEKGEADLLKTINEGIKPGEKDMKHRFPPQKGDIEAIEEFIKSDPFVKKGIETLISG